MSIVAEKLSKKTFLKAWRAEQSDAVQVGAVEVEIIQAVGLSRPKNSHVDAAGAGFFCVATAKGGGT